MGNSIFEFSHPCDHDELREMLGAKAVVPRNDQKAPLSFFLRMKCTLTNKGRNVNLKAASYKVRLRLNNTQVTTHMFMYTIFYIYNIYLIKIISIEKRKRIITSHAL
jgi:hypothetical protein